MHYPKVLERVDFPEQIFHRSFSLGAPDTIKLYRVQLDFLKQEILTLDFSPVIG